MAMLACALALLMAFEVEHEFIRLGDIDARLSARLSDGWEIVFSNFIYASPGKEAVNMLFIFKRTVP